MRIISGKYKGKRLLAPKNLPVRPTTDMAKEGLFNILSNRYDIPQLTILDLFTGTGNISFEFASRGAKAITAIDAHWRCVKFVKATALELAMSITTVKSDAETFLKRCSNSYDIIFADPPYDFGKEALVPLIDLVLENRILRPSGQLIIEHPTQVYLNDHDHFHESRKYGSSVFSFFGNSM